MDRKLTSLKNVLLKSLCLVLVSAPTLHAQALGLLDDGLSPLQRYINGAKISGVYKAENALYCSPQAKNKFIPDALPESAILFQSGSTAVTAGVALNEINRIVRQALGTLNFYGDSATTDKYLCTAFYQDRDSHTGNAKSHVHGYMIFDYNLLQFLNALPDENKSMWIYDFLVLHEFAHQLQYWNGDIEMQKSLSGEQSSKISELAADCTSAALLKLTNLKISHKDFMQLFKGATGVASLLGDFAKEDRSHHGTPVERTFATSFGVGYINSLVGVDGRLTESISSLKILNACNQFAKTSLSN